MFVPLSGLFVPTIAAGFASGAMLFWLAAAGIPIAIHLLSRRQKEHRQWAAMQLLLEVLEKESRRIRIEQLLLLAMRVLILVLLALALARPFLSDASQDGLAEGGKAPRLWIVAIDSSYSMAYQDEEDDLPQFERAKERATDAIFAAQPGDAFWIIQLADPVRLINQLPTFSKDAALAEIARLPQLHTGANMVEGLQLIEDLAQQAQLVDGLPQDIQVLVLTDLGEDSWLPVLQGDGSQSLDRLSKDYGLQVVSLQSNAPRNILIDQLQCDRSAIVLSEKLGVTVSVSNADLSNPMETRLALLLDDEVVEERDITLGPSESQSFRYSVQAESQGEHVITARTSVDNLVVDNERRQVVTVKKQTRLLIVSDEPDEAKLYETCLNPPGLRTRSSLQVESIRPTKLALQPLDIFDAILVANCENLDTSESERIAKYVEQGGGVVFLLGHRTSAASWNAMTEARYGFRIGSRSETGVVNIDPLNYESPIAKPFLGFPDAGLITTPIFSYWNVDFGGAFQKDLGLSDQSTFIASRRLGDGRVVVVTSAPDSGAQQVGDDASWNAIASWPSFVPLMDQIAETASQPDASRRNVLVGQAMRGTVSLEQSENLSMVSPGGTEHVIATRIDAKASLRRWSFRQTNYQGLYTLASGGEDLETYVANVEPDEGRLRSVKLPARYTRESIESSSSAESGEASLPEDDSISRLLLMVLFGHVIAESLVARWIGRRVR